MKNPRAWIFVAACLLMSLSTAQAKPKLEYATGYNIGYYDAASTRNDEYRTEHCKLDIYYPKDADGFATIVWFHGGGLTEGTRHFPALKDRGIALVAVSYRLAPKVQTPGFLQDAAAAVAWVLENVERYGGDPSKVFVAGHSAGAYLASMLTMDPKWLAEQGVSHRKLAGLIAVSGQMSTHFTIKKLRGDKDPQLRPVIDEYAPLHHVSKDLPPICLVVGGRDREWPARVEENALMAATLRALGHPKVEFYEMQGLNHGTVAEGGMSVMLDFVRGVLQPSE